MTVIENELQPRPQWQFNFSALGAYDVRNMALQRTNVLVRLPGFASIAPSFECWKRLRTNVLVDFEVYLRKSVILKRYVQEIETEFHELIGRIGLPHELRILDIGCGLGLMNIFFCRLSRVLRLSLVDIEQTEAKHHGFFCQGAGYNSLATTANFIADNITPGTVIETLNPAVSDIRSLAGKYDLITSFLSCGYHYPATVYLDVFNEMLATDGRIVIDLRLGQGHEPILNSFPVLREISIHKNRRRVVLCRMGGTTG